MAHKGAFELKILLITNCRQEDWRAVAFSLKAAISCSKTTFDRLLKPTQLRNDIAEHITRVPSNHPLRLLRRLPYISRGIPLYYPFTKYILGMQEDDDSDYSPFSCIAPQSLITPGRW